jgi:hypothetical protein
MEVAPMGQRIKSSRRMAPLPVRHSPESQGELEAMRNNSNFPGGGKDESDRASGNRVS